MEHAGQASHERSLLNTQPRPVRHTLCLSRQELPALVITFYYSTIGAVMTTAFALATGGFRAPQSWGDGAMLFATGVMGLVGQMFLTKGFQWASNAGSAAMIRCTRMLRQCHARRAGAVSSLRGW